ncbi:MAG TPA: hypothetical protein VHP31_02550 [Caproicibacter sp.]|nr:hypothetical protein [Caproicibacter sp.]
MIFIISFSNLLKQLFFKPVFAAKHSKAVTAQALPVLRNLFAAKWHHQRNSLPGKSGREK